MDILFKMIDSRKLTIGILLLLVLGIMRIVSLETSLSTTEKALESANVSIENLTDRLEAEERSSTRYEAAKDVVDGKYRSALEELERLNSEAPLTEWLELPIEVMDGIGNLKIKQETTTDEDRTPSKSTSSDDHELARRLLCRTGLAESHLCNNP